MNTLKKKLLTVNRTCVQLLTHTYRVSACGDVAQLWPQKFPRGGTEVGKEVGRWFQ